MRRMALSYEVTVTLFDKPPDGFDPAKAIDRDLVRYGYPVPHNDDQRAMLAAVYARIGTGFEHIEPDVRLQPSRGRTGRRGAGNIAGDTETNWAGASVPKPVLENGFFFVSAGLLVPNVAGPLNAYSEHWIGLDTENDVCQAGVECSATSGGPRTLPFAWVEWVPGPMMSVPNFAIYPGDTVYILVCVNSNANPLSATAYFSNVTQKTQTSFGFKAPPAANFFGLTAEWISERPIAADTMVVRPLANFGDAFFFDAVAGNANDSFQPQPGDDIQMIRALGDQTIICKAAVPAAGLVHTTWVSVS